MERLHTTTIGTIICSYVSLVLPLLAMDDANILGLAEAGSPKLRSSRRALPFPCRWGPDECESLVRRTRAIKDYRQPGRSSPDQ
jgi:hypothetical protein